MSKILDAFGQPIDMALLKSQVAAPTPYGVRTVGAVYGFSGLDPARLASLLRAAEADDPRAYLELAEEMEEKYLHYAAQLATRKRAVCGLEWQVVPASDRLRDRKIAEALEGVIPVLEAALFDMLDSLGKGFSVNEIEWSARGSTWEPVGIERRDPRWFQFDRVDGRTLRMRDIANPSQGLTLPPGKFIVSSVAAKSGLPVRGGLARAAAYAYLFHNFTLRDWVTFCERFGLPLRLGRYHEGALPRDLDILFSAVRDIGADAAAILPKGMEIEFPAIKSGSTSADLWEKLLAYLDSQVSKLVLGQTLTADTGRGGGGSYALGQVHNEVRIDILRSDAKAICTALNRDLTRIFVDLNFGPQAAYPALRLPVSEPEDMAALAANLKTLVEIGQPVGVAWVSDKFAIPLPDGDEPRLGMTAAGSAAAAVADLTTQRSTHRTAAEPISPTHTIAGQLGAASAAEVDAILGDLVAIVDGATDLDSLQDRLVNSYGDLDTTELARVMAAAFALAELKGIDAVAVENTVANRVARHAVAPAPVNHVNVQITLPEGLISPAAVHVAAPDVVVNNNIPPMPAPVVNNSVNVPTAAVPNVVITNDVRPAEVVLNLPPRKIETAILRDENGQIASATQIETTLEGNT